ncbi:MAG: PTS glucose transporter subunit IIA [Erysipelotrichaceae bacterium]|nr:PTS glucose transporter subunit IIA [Erysipelotrichaceae bacterium]
MALDYRKCAEEIYSHLGGKDNIASAAHCATRLRLAIVDINKVDTKALENVEGVKGVFSSNGQLQCIIGTGTVNKVYDEFLAVTGLTAASKDDVKAAAAASQPLPMRMVKSIGDVFVPILPAIVAAGLMMGLVEALGKIPGFGQAFAASDWYGFLDMVSATAFAYLPVLVAVSATRVFGGNIFLGATVGLAMINSALTNGWAAADGYEKWYLLGKGINIGGYYLGQINRLGYQGHVIPVIIAIWLMAKIEKKLHEVTPEVLDLFIVPLCTVLATCLITFMVIGPIFSTAENYVLAGARVLVQSFFGIGAGIMGALYPITVVMGLHHMYTVIEAGFLADPNIGLNIWMPVASSANFAQFGACLAVGLKTKSSRVKSVAIPSALSAALGITEPAIFGVNFRFMKPFIFGMVGGAAGSLFGAWTGLGAVAYGVTGIPGYLTINNLGLYTVMLAIAGGVAFALTTVLYKEDPDLADKKVVEEPAVAPDVVAMSTETGEVLQCTPGTIVAAKDIPDPVFASEAMGPSVGIQPTAGVVYAPFDGEVVMKFPTNHAVGLKSADGIELLIHVGVDTVNMNGEGFTPNCDSGDKIAKGDVLLEFDRGAIANAGYSDTVVVVITNGADYTAVKKAAE